MRRTQQVVSLLGLGILGVCLMCYAQQRPIQMPSAQNIPFKTVAHRLVLVDESGQERLLMRATPHGAYIEMKGGDVHNRREMVFDVGEGGSHIDIMSPKLGGVTIVVADDGFVQVSASGNSKKGTHTSKILFDSRIISK